MNSTANPERTLAFIPDLMDWSKVSAIPGLARTKDLGSVDLQDVTTLVVDLDKAELAHLAEIVSGEQRNDLELIGFCSHVNTELKSAAEDLGFRVLARSRFFGDPAQFIC